MVEPLKLNDSLKLSLVNLEDNDKTNNILKNMNREPSVASIPNLDILTAHVLEILRYIEDPKNRKAIRECEGEVRMMLTNKYADTVPYRIISLLMEEEDRMENVTRLLNTFDNLAKVKKGHMDIEDAEKSLIDNVNQRYLYSQYGSKEEFERQLAIEVQKERAVQQ